MGYSTTILNNSVSSLLAQQAAIATTSNNIANVNTEGYVRRSVQFEARGESASQRNNLSIGNGVKVSQIAREVDNFVEKMLREAMGNKAGYDIENDFYNRVQNLFSLNESSVTIGSALTEFSTAINALAAQPASVELRTNLIERGQDLVNAIHLSYNTVAELQTEADNRIVAEIDEVNALAAQIAVLNGQVSSREATGNVAADERDQRESLLQKLSEKIQYTLVEDNSGQANLYIGKGLALVAGTVSRKLETKQDPTFLEGNPAPPSLSSKVLNYIVFDYAAGAGSSDVDLTQALQGGTGSIGSLLKLRGANVDSTTKSPFKANGTLVDIASRIEAISMGLLTAVNKAYLGPTDEDSSTNGWQPTSGDLTGTQPPMYGLFDFAYTGDKDPDLGDLLPTSADLQYLTDNGLIKNFSSLIAFKPSDPREIAAAQDVDATENSISFATGDNKNLLDVLAALKSTATSLSAGNFSMTGSFDQAYNQLLTTVGTYKSRADANARVAGNNLLSAQTQRDSVSGVSLDEEFTALIRYQNAYQASARLIKIADELLAQIVQLV